MTTLTRRRFIVGSSAGFTVLSETSMISASSEELSLNLGETDRKLQCLLEERLGSFRGEGGVNVRRLPSGRTVSIRADELFPSASLIEKSGRLHPV